MAHPAFSGHCSKEAGWPTPSTAGARCRLNMKNDRFLFDSGHSLSRRAIRRNSERCRRIGGWAATSQDAASHMRQEGRGGAWN